MVELCRASSTRHRPTQLPKPSTLGCLVAVRLTQLIAKALRSGELETPAAIIASPDRWLKEHTFRNQESVSVVDPSDIPAEQLANLSKAVCKYVSARG